MKKIVKYIIIFNVIIIVFLSNRKLEIFHHRLLRGRKIQQINDKKKDYGQNKKILLVDYQQNKHQYDQYVYSVEEELEELNFRKDEISFKYMAFLNSSFINVEEEYEHKMPTPAEYKRRMFKEKVKYLLKRYKIL